MELPLAAAPLRLIADKNSWRVAALVRNVPSMQLVTIVTSDLCTPLVVMHSCAASTTTPTPKGLSTLSRHEAILAEVKKHGHDLIVMGVSRRPGDKLFFGDTAAAVLENSPASIVFVAS